MAVLNIRAHRMAALAVASVLSSTAIASTASTKVVFVGCATGYSVSAVNSCDKSTGVVASCPASGTSCAQAVAVFESAPDNLQLINVSSPANNILIYTLGSPGKE